MGNGYHQETYSLVEERTCNSVVDTLLRVYTTCDDSTPCLGENVRMERGLVEADREKNFTWGRGC